MRLPFERATRIASLVGQGFALVFVAVAWSAVVSFIVFKIAVILFTSLGGSTLMVVGAASSATVMASLFAVGPGFVTVHVNDVDTVPPELPSLAVTTTV